MHTDTPSPTTRVLKETRKHFKVVMIDEFRTTQVHYETNLRLSKVIESDKNGNKNQVRGLLWCDSTIGSKFYVDRDFNPGKQMLKCYFSYPIRPKSLRRDTETQPVPSPKYILTSRNRTLKTYQTKRATKGEILKDLKSLFE
jgi:hypothetical protein